MLDNLRHNKYRLPLCWHKTSGWMSKSEFVWLFGFRYAFPCLGWMRGLPLPYGQIRIINWGNFRAHFNIRERDGNRRIFENIHACLCCNACKRICFHWEMREIVILFGVWVKHERNIQYEYYFSRGFLLPDESCASSGALQDLILDILNI